MDNADACSVPRAPGARMGASTSCSLGDGVCGVGGADGVCPNERPGELKILRADDAREASVFLGSEKLKPCSLEEAPLAYEPPRGMRVSTYVYSNPKLDRIFSNF